MTWKLPFERLSSHDNFTHFSFTMSKKILITTALPYANGDLHLGHLVENIQADIWVRHQRQLGKKCLHFCADDTHGTPMMINARQQGISPETLIAGVKEKHIKDFNEFGIIFTHYSSTHSHQNEIFCSKFFQSMEKKGLIESREIDQAYCELDQMFLPDRFVLGECPKCGAKNQYGDACDVCSSTYDTTDLKNPRCSLCNNPSTRKKSQHLFFKLNEYKEFLKKWVTSHTSKEIANKLNEWLNNDLRSWDISRDAPYFGFEIPGHPGKYFYVWLDAPLCYLATTKEWCEENGEKFDDWWQSDKTEIHHFIGKDIVYFHTLFWPAMLEAAGYAKPNQVHVHGFLMVNGKKMSKSKGTSIKARTYLDHLDPEYLRYYFACKLGTGIEDIDLNMDDFLNRVNSDLVGKLTNIASRGAQMLQKKLDGRLGSISNEGQTMIQSVRDKSSVISDLYLRRDYIKVMIIIRAFADNTNRYFDEKTPWNLIKTDEETTRSILTDILNIFRLLSIYLKPVIPNYVSRVEELFCSSGFIWSDIETVLENKELSPFKPLITKIEKSSLKKIIDDSKMEAEKNVMENMPAKNFEPIAEQIDFDVFMKVDLRVAKIIEAEKIEGADKLLKLKVDIGLETREIIAGIKLSYNPDELIGRQVIIAANLKPRKMKFGISDGMVLAAGEVAKELYILSPDNGAKAGQRIS